LLSLTVVTLILKGIIPHNVLFVVSCGYHFNYDSFQCNQLFCMSMDLADKLTGRWFCAAKEGEWIQTS